MRAVVALGGNAILSKGARGTVEEQRDAVRRACAGLARLVVEGHELVVTHGNGPQVGRALLQQRAAERDVPPMPLDVLGAATQGQIGYLLQQELADALHQRGAPRAVATVITQVVIDPDDPRMQVPDKPVGPHYTAVELEHVTGARLPGEDLDAWTLGGVTWRKVAGGTWRRVVPSPLPVDLVEVPAVLALLEHGVVPVCAGGGGVPIVRRDGRTEGVEAVVDKDRTAAVLAGLVDAEALLILTDVPHVLLGYGTPEEEPLEELTTTRARELLAAGAFPAGSMGPKVQAAVERVDAGGVAAITSLERAGDALHGEAGTRIVAG